MNETGLIARVKAMQEKYGRHSQEPKTLTEQSPVSRKLPLWSDSVRAVPNAVLRSALFTATRGGRINIERQKVHAQEGASIFFTGPRLDQADLDVWETTLHLAQHQDLGEVIHVKAYRLLQILGITDSGNNRAGLERHLSRLNAAKVEIRTNRHLYEGKLIDGVDRDKLTRVYHIRLNPGLQQLFASNQYTRVHWAIRQALRGKPLAQWLHGYYSTHAAPYPVTIATLHRLCGSTAQELWKFTQTLRAALQQLSLASGAHDQPFSFIISDGLVSVEKCPSSSQRRHLAKRVRPKTEHRPSG